MIFLDSQIQMILIKATSENVYYDAVVLLKISGLVSELLLVVSPHSFLGAGLVGSCGVVEN